MKGVFGQSPLGSSGMLDAGESDTGASSGHLIVSFDFLFKFAICCICLYALAIQLPTSAFGWLNSHTALMAACILKVLGIHPVLNGNILSQDSFTVKIMTERSVLYMGIVFFSFIIAYPTLLQRKVIGFALGIAMLHTGNILRIALLFAMGTKLQSSFEYVHVYLREVLAFLLLIAVCLAWLRTWACSTPENGFCSFFLRFAALSNILFLLWLPLNEDYARLIDSAVTSLFSLFHQRLAMPQQNEIHYQTFNLVILAGLVLVTRSRPLRWKLQMFALGFASVFSMHILFRVCNVVIPALHGDGTDKLATAIAVAGQYLLPVLLWMLMASNETAVREEEHQKE